MNKKGLRIILFIVFLIPFTLGTRILFSSEVDTISIICTFNGEGKIRNDAPLEIVKIEQKVSFNDYSVKEFEHHFITDYDYNESMVVDDGLMFGWLSFVSLVTKDKIRVFSEMSEKPKKSSAVKVKNFWYNLDMTISRKTGIGVRKVSYSFEIDKGPAYTHEYNVYGDCKERENKF